MSDLISREDAIKALCYCCGIECTEEEMQTCPEHYELTHMPSAEPERKKGEWLELTNTNHTYVCSVCGRMLVNITNGKNTVTKNYPFCHCGADMRGDSDV